MLTKCFCFRLPLGACCFDGVKGTPHCAGINLIVVLTLTPNANPPCRDAGIAGDPPQLAASTVPPSPWCRHQRRLPYHAGGIDRAPLPVALSSAAILLPWCWADGDPTPSGAGINGDSPTMLVASTRPPSQWYCHRRQSSSRGAELTAIPLPWSWR